MTILFDSSSSAEAIARSLRPEAVIATSVADVEALLRSSDHDLVVIGPEVDHTAACALAASQRWGGSAVGVVLTRHRLESAVLREAMVAGVRDVVAVDDLDGLAQACQRSLAVTQQLRQAQPSARASEQPTGEIVTVFASKGGCGKTTLATNLATAFARSGRRTCLVDLDLAFGDVAITMQLQPQRTIADALGLSALDGTAVRSLVTTHSSGVDAILAPVEPGTAEAVSAELIGDLLEVLKTLYDVVVLDTPPAFTEHVLAAFDRADHSVLITTLDIPALKNLKLTLETLDMLGYPRDRWRWSSTGPTPRSGCPCRTWSARSARGSRPRCRPVARCPRRSTGACRSCSTSPGTR